MRKFLGSFRHNIGMKLISVLVAIVIWYAVVNVSDPVETNSYTVKVTVTNEEYINNNKEIYHIDDEFKTVTVFVRANRSALKGITADDITVTADLAQIVDMTRTPRMVPLSARCAGLPQTAITLSRQTIPIEVETVESKDFPVVVDTGDSSPSQGYEVGTVTADPDQVSIKGPTSIIGQIDSVVARIDVTGMTRSGEKKGTLILLGKDQQEISPETVEDELTFVGGTPEISVYVELWQRLSDIGLEVAYSGMPAKGYHVERVSTTPDTVTVAGSEEALQDLADAGGKITIPEKMIYVAGMTKDVVTEIDLNEILPADMRIAKNTPETVIVTIGILSDETIEYTVDVDDIEVNGLAANMVMTYAQTKLTLPVTGSNADLSRLSAENVRASIDLKGYAAGDYTVPVSMELPAGVSLSGEAVVSVSLKERIRATETEEAPGQEQ